MRLVLCFALMFVPVVADAELLVNGDFETQADIAPVQPTTTGVWSVDPATIVTAENGISPFSGSRMLRFDGTFPGFTIDGSTGEVAQLVDVTSLRPETGTVSATVAARFNRVVSSNDKFDLSLSAYSGLPSSYPAGELTRSTVRLDADADLSTWEQLQTGIDLPTSTTYLSVQLIAFDTAGNSPPNEFAGHYADAVSLTFNGVQPIPEPSSLLALSSLCISGLAFGVWRRNKRR